MRRAVFFLLACFIMASANIRQALEKYQVFVEKQKEVDSIPGISVAIMKGKFVWAKGFGYCDLEHRTPATAHTAYRLASVTKPMTAVAVLQLYEKGKVDLDAEVQKYVPYFPRKRWPVTVRLLLGHLAGISHYRSYRELHIKEHKDTRDALAIFAGFELVAKPGTAFHYSSYGYNLLGAVIEGAARMPYGKYMRKYVWDPAGMKETRMDSPDEIIPERARGYRIVDGRLINSEFIDMSSRFAAGGTRSTVLDLVKFIAALRDGKLLRKKTIDMMWTSMSTSNGLYTDYGMGWRVRPVNGRFCVYHTGSQAETRTLLAYFPLEDLAIAVACNLEGANQFLYGQRLYQLIFRQPWNFRIYAGDAVAEAILKAMDEVYNYGLSYYRRYGKPLSSKEIDLIQAFSYFNHFANPEYIRSHYKEALEKIKEGRHPFAKEVFVKMGSFMAEVLSKERDLEFYHAQGPVAFFHDYIKTAEERGLSPRLRFSSSLQELISRWWQDWKQVYTPYTATLFISAYSDLDQIGKKLRSLFSGATIYPDFSYQLEAATRYFYLKRKKEKAFKAAKLCLQLYPDSALALANLANTHLAFGEKEKALRIYRKALKAKVGLSAVQPSAILRQIGRLLQYGKIDQALQLAEIAEKLYPEDARFPSAIADIYIEKARRLYRKALEKDPNYTPAWRKLKRLKEEYFFQL